MIQEKDIQLFHRNNIEREIIPIKYQLNNDNKKKLFLKPIGNISKNQEDQIIFSNITNNLKSNQFKKSRLDDKNNFLFNNIINIDKNKIMTYFLCNNYEEMFSLFEFYIINLFNGCNMKQISNLFERNLISDEIYAKVKYCMNIINLYKKSYNHLIIKNINNTFHTTEIIVKRKDVFQENPKIEVFSLITQFIELLNSIDEIGYIKEIDKLNEILAKNNN